LVLICAYIPSSKLANESEENKKVKISRSDLIITLKKIIINDTEYHNYFCVDTLKYVRFYKKI